MAMIIGGLAAMVALVAGIVAQVDSTTILQRAGISFVVGAILGVLWQMLSTIGGKDEVVFQEDPSPVSDSHVQTGS